MITTILNYFSDFCLIFSGIFGLLAVLTIICNILSKDCLAKVKLQEAFWVFGKLFFVLLVASALYKYLSYNQ